MSSPTSASTNATPGQEKRQNSNFSLFCELLGLLRPLEFIISVDHFPAWRTHLAWSHTSGNKLRDLMTQRFASNMVVLSLFLSTELSVLFSPSSPAHVVRLALADHNLRNYQFYAGLLLCCCIMLTICALVATFTAWAIVSSLSDANAHCVLRSTLGLYACQLPSRLIVSSLYVFLSWVILFLFVLLPNIWAVVLTVLGLMIFFHIVSVYSSLGKVIMYTRAMGKDKIFEGSEEEELLSFDLYTRLIYRAKEYKPLYMNQIPNHYRYKDEEMALGSDSNSKDH